MSAIFLKEIKSYFKSLFGWIYLAAFTFFASVYFISNHIKYGSPYISESLSGMVMIVIFILPLLTMRIIAEEKRQKTDQFLITAPISLVKVIFGKYFALCAIMLVSTIIMAMGVGVICIYGSVPVAETILSLLGFFLFGCECVAIGMFLSSITEHQFLAAIFTYGVYIATLIIPSFTEYIFGSDKFITKIVKVTDIYAPFNGLMTGILKISDVLYILSVIAIFLILAYKIFAKNSVQLSAMGQNRFFISFILPFAIIAGIVGLNIGCKYIPTKYTEFDLTKNRWYSITDETKALLDSLDEDVVIYVISSKDAADETIVHYLDSYDTNSKHIKVVYKSEIQEPNFYMNYTEKKPYSSSLIVTKGNDFRVIEYDEMFEYSYNSSYTGYNITGFDVEGQLTSAISSLISGDDVIHVYNVIGHEELSLNQKYIKDYLGKGHFVFEDINIYGNPVPENCDLLVINGPATDFSEKEVQYVKDYINKGGKAIMMAAFDIYDLENYDALIESFYVDMTEGTVIEEDYKNLFAVEDPTSILMSPDYSSPFTIKTGKKNLLVHTRGFKYDDETLPDNVRISNIFETSDSAFAKYLASGTSIDHTDDSEDGPFSLGVYVQIYNDDDTVSGVVLIGAGGFLYDSFDQYVSYSNSELFDSMAQRMVDKEVTTLVPVKKLSYEYIKIGAGMQIFYLVICCLVLPLALLIAGLAIIIIRRRK